ncbi:MAG: hypothetical protein LBE59_02390 [Nevskiaceae bacterium]|jgi:hypothetical protein|nr:hypothetical protein [Nevskiaceae bacterium]
MNKTFSLAATAASLLAVLAVAPAFAQSSIPQENEAAARRTAQEAQTKALIEAERTRPRIAGYWRVDHKIDTLTTADGKTPPLNAAGRTLYRQRTAANRAGKSDDPMLECLPPGTPRSLLVDEPFMIAQAPVKVTFFFQVHHVIRHIWLDGPLQMNEDERENLWEGRSSGRWEGDTLIIETGDFNGKQWLDASGLPQSPDMRVTERIRKVDANTLENLITYQDAKYYSSPWTARLVFKAQPASTILIEEDCAEKLLEFPLKEYAPQ